MEFHLDLGPFCISFSIAWPKVGHEAVGAHQYTDVSAEHQLGFVAYEPEEYEDRGH